MKHNDQQPEGDFFIGARLSERRQKLGIQLEKAAKDIRVSVSRLSQIEADDFSSFAHPTYARLFLVDYANYLRVPLEDDEKKTGEKRFAGMLEYLIAGKTTEKTDIHTDGILMEPFLMPQGCEDFGYPIFEVDYSPDFDVDDVDD